MSEERDPSWIHLLDDVIGLAVIVVALVAVLELAFSFAYALEILSLGLVAMGIAWIVWAIYIMHSHTYVRIFMFLTGVAAIAVAVIDFLFISLPPNLLIIYPAIAMLLVGLSRIVLGVVLGELPLWIQMLQVLAGILTLNLAAFVFIFPSITFPTMLILLVLSLLANGLVRLIVGRTDVRKQRLQSRGDTTPSEQKSDSMESN
ncbi:MAG: hypothetical protein ACFFDQ_08615 [Candidatus Thorarchaeota archaeon]